MVKRMNRPSSDSQGHGEGFDKEEVRAQSLLIQELSSHSNIFSKDAAKRVSNLMHEHFFSSLDKRVIFYFCKEIFECSDKPPHLVNYSIKKLKAFELLLEFLLSLGNRLDEALAVPLERLSRLKKRIAFAKLIKSVEISIIEISTRFFNVSRDKLRACRQDELAELLLRSSIKEGLNKEDFKRLFEKLRYLEMSLSRIDDLIFDDAESKVLTPEIAEYNRRILHFDDFLEIIDERFKTQLRIAQTTELTKSSTIEMIEQIEIVMRAIANLGGNEQRKNLISGICIDILDLLTPISDDLRLSLHQIENIEYDVMQPLNYAITILEDDFNSLDDSVKDRELKELFELLKRILFCMRDLDQSVTSKTETIKPVEATVLDRLLIIYMILEPVIDKSVFAVAFKDLNEGKMETFIKQLAYIFNSEDLRPVLTSKEFMLILAEITNINLALITLTTIPLQIQRDLNELAEMFKSSIEGKIGVDVEELRAYCETAIEELFPEYLPGFRELCERSVIAPELVRQLFDLYILLQRFTKYVNSTNLTRIGEGRRGLAVENQLAIEMNIEPKDDADDEDDTPPWEFTKL